MEYPPAMPPTLSVVTPTIDSAGVIGACVDAALCIADEVVVVDTGSQDATVDEARAAGARVVELDPAAFDYSVARNLGAAAASGDWLLHLDTDEVIDPADAGVVRRAIAGGAFDVFDIPQLTLWHDGTTSLHLQRRLCRNRRPAAPSRAAETRASGPTSTHGGPPGTRSQPQRPRARSRGTSREKREQEQERERVGYRHVLVPVGENG